MPTGPRNSQSVQVAIRIPIGIHRALLATGRPIAEQVIEAVRGYWGDALAQPTAPRPGASQPPRDASE